jgi:hypothetical protein
MTDNVTLFEAVRDGVPVTVTLAKESEIENIARPLSSGQDVLEFWSLIAFRFEDARCEIHALGWRRYLSNTWITSRIVGVDLTTGAIRTRSGRQYWLGDRDQPTLAPELRSHLRYALQKWGFDDVRP